MKANYLLLLQGSYTTLTGAWPVVHMDSFLRITGPKHDVWLVKTVALLLVCTGLSFLNSVRKTNDAIPAGIILLSLTTAITLAAVDIHYVLQNVISIIYLMDALIEILFLLFWIFIFARYLYIRKRELINFVS